MRRVRSLFLPSLVLVGLLLPASWTAIDEVQASSGGVPPFKGVVIKCVGFNLLFITEEGLVYVHNDGSNALVARVRFLDSLGNTQGNTVNTILPGRTAAFSAIGTDPFRTMVAKVTSSEPTVIVDAERVGATGTALTILERRHITCAPSDEAPDFLPG